MTEKALWRALRPHLNVEHWHAIRVENPALPGTPDVNYVGHGVEGWIELKQIASWPKDKRDLVRIPHYRPEQKEWLSTRFAKGGRCYMLLQAGRRWLLLSGRYARVIGQAPAALLESFADYDLEGLDAAILRRVLIDEAYAR
jgi:hypothetical protein